MNGVQLNECLKKKYQGRILVGFYIGHHTDKTPNVWMDVFAEDLRNLGYATIGFLRNDAKHTTFGNIQDVYCVESHDVECLNAVQLFIVLDGETIKYPKSSRVLAFSHALGGIPQGDLLNHFLFFDGVVTYSQHTFFPRCLHDCLSFSKRETARRSGFYLFYSGYPKIDVSQRKITTGNDITVIDTIIYAPKSLGVSSEWCLRQREMYDVELISTLLDAFKHVNIVFRPYPRDIDSVLTNTIVRYFSKSARFAMSLDENYMNLYKNTITVISDMSAVVRTFSATTGRPGFHFQPENPLAVEGKNDFGYVVTSLDSLTSNISNIFSDTSTDFRAEYVCENRSLEKLAKAMKKFIFYEECPDTVKYISNSDYIQDKDIIKGILYFKNIESLRAAYSIPLERMSPLLRHVYALLYFVYFEKTVNFSENLKFLFKLIPIYPLSFFEFMNADRYMNSLTKAVGIASDENKHLLDLYDDDGFRFVLAKLGKKCLSDEIIGNVRTVCVQLHGDSSFRGYLSRFTTVILTIGDTKLFRTVMCAALRCSKEKDYILYLFGRFHFELKKIVSATRFARKAYLISPNDIDYLLLLLRCEVALKQHTNVYALAMDFLERSQDSSSNDKAKIALIYYILSQSFAQQFVSSKLLFNQDDLAIEHALKAIELKPEAFSWRYHLSNLYRRTNRLDDAEAVVKEGMVLDPAPGEGHIQLSFITASRQQDDLAIEHALKAIELKPEVFSWRYHLSNLYRRTNRLDDAEAVVKEGMVLDPSPAEAYHQLAKIFEARKEFPAALEFVEKALSLRETDTYKSAYQTILKKKNELKQNTEVQFSQEPDRGENTIDINFVIPKAPSALLSNDTTIKFIAETNIFDREYYLASNPDVAQAKLDPIEHYVNFGAKELRNPAGWFDTAWYCRKYLDVVAAEVNPFWHFLRFGFFEGRSPKFVAENNLKSWIDELNLPLPFKIENFGKHYDS